jgi:hypothetical protein
MHSRRRWHSWAIARRACVLVSGGRRGAHWVCRGGGDGRHQRWRQAIGGRESLPGCYPSAIIGKYVQKLAKCNLGSGPRGRWFKSSRPDHQIARNWPVFLRDCRPFVFLDVGGGGPKWPLVVLDEHLSSTFQPANITPSLRPSTPSGALPAPSCSVRWCGCLVPRGFLDFVDLPTGSSAIRVAPTKFASLSTVARRFALDRFDLCRFD